MNAREVKLVVIISAKIIDNSEMKIRGSNSQLETLNLKYLVFNSGTLFIA